MRRLTCTLSLLLLAACATAAPSGSMGVPPNLTPAAGEPAPPQAQFYADCIAQAAQTRQYDREGNTLRFQCSGPVAEAFYTALARWSAEHGAELQDGGRTLRFTQRPSRNVSGLDFCWRAPAGDPAYGCTVVLNVGEFLEQTR